ncbi:MAG: FAD-binding protein [Coriobacteriales bacterium]|jgi:flavin-dependent dehydrogenase|nr:FAD-binding protein [Coriobacteriales bacterium]
MQDKVFDIAVIGLGPAGSFLVKHLDPGLRVIAIDRKSPLGDSGFHKPCGGLLAPDAQKALSAFNMTLPKSILVDPQIFSVQTIDVQTALVRHYQRFYVNLNRHRFDQWLMSQIPDQVQLHTNAICKSIVQSEGRFTVNYLQDGQTHCIQAKYLVGADGAHSLVRRSLFKDFKIKTYLSIQQWFADAHSTPFYSCVFDSELTDSYAWGLTKDDSFIFGGAFAIGSGRRDFEQLKTKLQPYGFRLENPIKTEACLVLQPFGPRNYCYGQNNAFLIGEAAGFISPSSLEGISYAIDSGYLLSQCLNNQADDPNRAYRRGTRRIRLKLMAKYLKRPFMYNQTSRKLIMQSGLMSIPILT